jgi:murein DD-endopeptidase MepM/ murein hydrolase activator NlpD
MDYRGPQDIAPIDLSETNAAFTAIPLRDSARLCAWFEEARRASGRKFLAGGYGENRAIYLQSAVFGEAEPRTVHLGVDLWGAAGEPVFAPLAGRIHSFRDNAAFGDYGPTLILEHTLEGGAEPRRVYSLYGHLSRASLTGWRTGAPIEPGERIGWLGEVEENGNWPPHLHFQLIADLGGRNGDYPGVASRSEAPRWLAHCPNPEWLLSIGL